MLYMFFWVSPRRQIVVCRRFGTLCQFHLQRLDVEYTPHPAFEDGTDRGFWNVGKPQSDAREIPKRTYTSTEYIFVSGLKNLVILIVLNSRIFLFFRKGTASFISSQMSESYMLILFNPLTFWHPISNVMQRRPFLRSL